MSNGNRFCYDLEEAGMYHGRSASVGEWEVEKEGNIVVFGDDAADAKIRMAEYAAALLRQRRKELEWRLKNAVDLLKEIETDPDNWIDKHEI